MTKKRNRVKQTTTLEERLSRFTASLQQQAENIPPNTEQALQLNKRLRSCDAALRLNDALSARR